jgi:CRISPR-associated protein Cmr3
LRNWYLLTPIDVVIFRGNVAFEGPEGAKSAMMPPPSVVAGVLRTELIKQMGEDPKCYARGQSGNTELLKILGSPDKQDGTFRVAFWGLAVRRNSELQLAVPVPSDVIVRQAGEGYQVSLLDLADGGENGVTSLKSLGLAKAPVDKSKEGSKPVVGMWLVGEAIEGWANRDKALLGKGLARPDELFVFHQRLGIARDRSRRSAAEGMLYTQTAVQLKEGVSFVVAVDGCLPLSQSFVRLGGDGHPALLEPIDDDSIKKFEPLLYEPGSDYHADQSALRLALVTPGVFSEGWKWSRGPKVLAAKTGYPEVVSGFDMARRVPKPALMATPSGSVYWIEVSSGNETWIKDDSTSHPELNRRYVEGFNTFIVGRSS